MRVVRTLIAARVAVGAGLLIAASSTGLLAQPPQQPQKTEPPASEPLPPRYEISINGESFTVQANRLETLTSKDKPDVSYQVAVRLAEYQVWRLNRIEFDFHRGFRVSDDQAERLRTATMKHGLGFAMILSDLGGTLGDDRKEKALSLVIEAAQQSIRAEGGSDLHTSKPASRKFRQVDGRGVIISYQDRGSEARTLAYLLTTDKLACSCIIQYLPRDQDTVLPLVKTTMESLRLISDD